MKRILSILLACVLVFSQFIFCINVYASTPLSPIISLEISDYDSSGELIAKSGRGKTSAAAGDKIAITFIIRGIYELEYYQLYANFDDESLRPGYYSGGEWVTGDSEQDFDTIIAGSREYTNNAFNDSFSFTRTVLDPMLCIIGFCINDVVSISDGTRLATVGFEVLEDIENIYDMFTWDDTTTVAASFEREEYTLSDSLTISCIHEFSCEVVQADCNTQGYTLYSCNNCSYSYKTDYADALSHHYAFSGFSSTRRFVFYKCQSCGNVTDKTKDDLLYLWRAEYINTQPSFGSDTQFLDLNTDGVLNAKDYAIIKNF